MSGAHGSTGCCRRASLHRRRHAPTAHRADRHRDAVRDPRPRTRTPRSSTRRWPGCHRPNSSTRPSTSCSPPRVTASTRERTTFDLIARRRRPRRRMEPTIRRRRGARSSVITMETSPRRRYEGSRRSGDRHPDRQRAAPRPGLGHAARRGHLGHGHRPGSRACSDEQAEDRCSTDRTIRRRRHGRGLPLARRLAQVDGASASTSSRHGHCASATGSCAADHEPTATLVSSCQPASRTGPKNQSPPPGGGNPGDGERKETRAVLHTLCVRA